MNFKCFLKSVRDENHEVLLKKTMHPRAEKALAARQAKPAVGKLVVLRGKAARKSHGVLHGGQVGKVVYARADPRHPPERARAHHDPSAHHLKILKHP